MRLLLGFIILCGCCFSAGQALAFQWQARPNLTMSEAFDDNLQLASVNKKSGFVSQVTPGLFLNGQSPWSNFNLNYRLQGFYNDQGSDAIDIYHQLQTNSLLQPIQNTLFIQSSSSISQQNITPGLLATDSVAGRRNMVTNENFNIAPYLTPHFGQVATGLLKFGYGRSFFNEPNTSSDSTQTSNLISNSQTIQKQAGLTSGAYFNVFSWNLNYSSQDQTQSGSPDVIFENYTANGRYFINRNYNVFLQTGYENNSYQTAGNNGVKNGFFYTGGMQWQPSLWYSMELGVGNNDHVTIRYNPSNNLNSFVTYRYNNVGLNLGSSWDAGLNYTTLRSRWGVTYHQDTTTVQQILASQNVFANNGIGVGGGSQVGYLLSNPSLLNNNNGALISRQANFNVSYMLGRTTLNASAYNTRRSYLLSQEQDTVYGLSGGLQWQVISRLNFYLQPLWQSTRSTLTELNSSLYQVAMGLTRGIPINLGRPLMLNTTLDLRHIEETGSGITTNNYIENRATANFFVQF